MKHAADIAEAGEMSREERWERLTQKMQDRLMYWDGMIARVESA